MQWLIKIPILLIVVIVTASCGGGGGNGGTPFDLNTLSGDWFGVHEDPAGGLNVVTVHLDGAHMSSDFWSGSISLPGTLSSIQNNIVGIVFTNGIKAMLFFDDSKSVILYGDQQGAFGVFERNITALPVYQGSDTDGHYAGQSVKTNFVSYQVSGIHLSCAGYDCSNDMLDVHLSTTPTLSFGRWPSSYIEPNVGVVLQDFIMSADKKYLGSLACLVTDPVSAFPDNCSFNLLARLN